ncbi:MAG: hypothetical protein Q7R52_03670 [archaeon]|nr:hypothetical protein [archaeon]
MKKLTKKYLNEILEKKGFNPKISWFYIQFKKKFEDEWVIDNINLEPAMDNLISFLNKKKIKEVLFFQEPSGVIIEHINKSVAPAFIETNELKQFLDKKIYPLTNSHIASKNLDWIFTITHEDDFFISGDKNLVKEFISFFKDANCRSYEDIAKKWAKK